MEIMPIKSFRESESTIFGINIYNLAKLKMKDLPVKDCIAISPPDFILQTTLKYFENAASEVFEQSLRLIKKEVEKIPMPEEFNKGLGIRTVFYLNNIKFHDKKILWKELLKVWLLEIKSNILRLGFDKNIKINLSAQLIYFEENKKIISAYFNPENTDVVINSDVPLTPKVSKKINDLIISANKVLLIPQIYYLSDKGENLEIVFLKPYTQSQPLSSEKDVIIKTDAQKKIIRSAVKIFLNLKSGFAVTDHAEGLIIEANIEHDFDESVFRLLEGGLFYSNKPVIFQLPENSAFLLSKPEILESLAKAYLFARNKKGLLNIELALPTCFGIEDMLEIKRHLSSQGISRKGTMKIWQLITIPENIINLSKYLEEGIDGVIIDLDELLKALFNSNGERAELLKYNVGTLIKFIDPFFKICHQANSPVVAKGIQLMHPEMLDFLVEKGIYGVAANNPIEAENLPETLSWVEERIVSKKSN